MGLPFAWTSPNAGRKDVQGRRLRGHRRPFVDAVYVAAQAAGRLTQRCPFCGFAVDSHETVTIREGTLTILGCTRKPPESE